MSKRGQITIFIIIGIIIVMTASFVFFLARNISSIDTKQSLSTETTDVQSIKGFVQGCVDNAAEQAIVLVGQQGGHIVPPNNKIELQDFSISYDYYEGQNLLPTKDQIEQDMSKYVSENIFKCVDESKSKLSSDLELGEIKTISKIDDDAVSFDVSYPITTKYFEKTEKLDGDFKATADVRLSHVLDVANSIVDQEIANANWINISYLDQTGLIVEVYNPTENDVIYVLTDTTSQANYDNFTFVFANKFKPNSPPDMLAFGAKQVQFGKEIVVEAKAIDLDGDEITYSGIDNRVMDENTGVIKFMSSIAGTYTFQIRATDAHGDHDEEELVIKVIA